MNTGILTAILIIAALQSNPASAGDAPVTITLVGTENINGVGFTPAQYRFPARMAVALAAGGANVTIKSAGIQETTADGLRWLTQSKDGQALLAAPAHHAIILELGVHDCFHLTLDQTKANFDRILATLGAKGIPVLLVGARAHPFCPLDYPPGFTAAFREMATKYGLQLYPDFLDAVWGNPDFTEPNVRDALYPNEAGEQAIVDEMLPLVAALVAQVGK